MKQLLLLLFLLPTIVFGQTTAIPDANFEQALIDLGYDTGTPDGSVLTANISGITSLSVYSKGISDLTGIEECWSKIKAFLRGPAGRRLEELEKYIAKTLEQYSGMVKVLWVPDLIL